MAQRNALQNHMQGNDNRQMTQGKPNGAQLASFLEKHKAQFAAALPKHLNPDRMIRLALTAFNSNKAIQNCDMNSIAASIITASQLGLEIGVAGQAYLVPYKGKCQCIPGWQGYVDLVSRSGRATVWTGAVFDGDDFDFALGDSPFVRHRPGGEDDPAKLVYVYAIGRVNGSEWPVIEVWPIAKVRRHFNKQNKVGDAHYAHQNWEMYARKIPLLQVIKYMPKSIELTNALTGEAAYETGHTYTINGDTVTIDDQPPERIEHSGNDSQAGGNGITAQDVHDALIAAKTEDKLTEAGDLIRDLPEADRPALNELWQKRADELAA
ncbi:recombinase RecT [Frateuria edaphi]|uniref:recombinase RecT n=1 Tax=Frateuria edaphi TaxID=2898793 RepID=UPI001E2A3631|nr:recombinase RecT [Frateuria edaphi]UGB46957.1 recombinase RecT [Frateuria edaphi]